MLNRTRHILALSALAFLASALGGCGTVNEKLGASMGDYLPVWAGGEPADVPPRPGTAKYDEYMKERERKRLIPAAERGDDPKDASKDASKDGSKPAPTATPTPSSQDAIH
jgi:hypothetical protein